MILETRNPLFRLLWITVILLALYGCARYATGWYMQWRITETLREIGYESDHQVDVRAYQRGLLSSQLNLIVDSPVMKGVLNVEVIHGPLFNRGSVGLADIIVHVPARAWVSFLEAQLAGSPLAPFRPRLDLAPGSVLPPATIDARVFPNGSVSGLIELTDVDHREASASGVPEVIRWQGLEAVFDAMPDNGPVFFQLGMDSLFSSDALGRQVSFSNLTLDGEFAELHNPHGRQTLTLFLDQTEIQTRHGRHLALDGLELQRIVSPKADWLREYDLAVPSAKLRRLGGQLVPFHLNATLQLSHLDAVEWSHLMDDLNRGSGDAVVWSELARSQASLRVSHFDIGFGEAAGHSFGALRLKPLDENLVDPWQGVDGKIYLEFDRALLASLVDWDAAPYFSGAVADAQQATPDLSQDQLFADSLEQVITRGWLKPMGQHGLAAVLDVGEGGLRLNGLAIGADD